MPPEADTGTDDRGPGKDPLTFDSPEDLAQVLGALSSRLHYANRVALGESRFAVEYAECLAALARMAPLLRDDAVRRQFGDGWTAGQAGDTREAFLQHLSDNLSHP